MVVTFVVAFCGTGMFLGVGVPGESTTIGGRHSVVQSVVTIYQFSHLFIYLLQAISLELACRNVGVREVWIAL